MSTQPSPDITKKNLYRLIGGNYGNLPTDVRKELKKAGLIKLLADKRISRQKSLKILRHLHNKGLIKQNKHLPTSKIWRQAAIEQMEQDRATREARVREYAFSLIKDELSEEALSDLDPLDRSYAQRKLAKKEARRRGSALHATFNNQGPTSSFFRRNKTEKSKKSTDKKPTSPQKPQLVV